MSKPQNKTPGNVWEKDSLYYCKIINLSIFHNKFHLFMRTSHVKPMKITRILFVRRSFWRFLPFQACYSCQKMKTRITMMEKQALNGRNRQKPQRTQDVSKYY